MALEESVNTRRALRLSRPSLRGVSHVGALVAAVPAGLWLVASAPHGRPRIAAGAFAVTVVLLFAASGLLHHREWSARTYEVLFRLDHTAIFLVFGGTATAIALLGLDGLARTVLLVGMWTAVAAGIVIEWLPFPPPRGAANTVYLTLGWLSVPFMPALWASSGWVPVALLLAGGACYTVGAVIVALRRPDPAPETFGYHEIFHLLVIVAVGLHYAMVARLLPS